jgi:hypothetical protein
MNRRRVVTVALIGGLAAVVALVLYVSRNFEVWAVAVHQRGVTRSLGEWEGEYSGVTTWPEADRAIGMLEYVQGYYVPGPGYRSDPQTELALETQRARTAAAIAAGLREFSGEDFGVDVPRWRAWREQHGPRPPERE